MIVLSSAKRFKQKLAINVAIEFSQNEFLHKNTKQLIQYLHKILSTSIRLHCGVYYTLQSNFTKFQIGLNSIPQAVPLVTTSGTNFNSGFTSFERIPARKLNPQQ